MTVHRALHRDRPGVRGVIVAATLVVVISACGTSGEGTNRDENPSVPTTVASGEAVSVDVGRQPTDVTFAEGSIWVLNRLDATLSRVDPERAEVEATIEIEASIASVVGAEGSIWVGAEDRIVQIDPETDEIVATIDLGGPVGVTGLAFADGSLWAGAFTDDAVLRIDPGSGEVKATIDVSEFIEGPIGLAAVEGDVFVGGGRGNGGVARIDPASDEVADVMEVPPVVVDLVEAESSLWATSSTDTVSRIDPFSGRVESTVDVGDGPVGLAVGEDLVWAANNGARTISGIDPSTSEVTRTIDAEFAGPPAAIAYGDGHLWLVDSRTLWQVPTSLATEGSSPETPTTETTEPEVPTTETTEAVEVFAGEVLRGRLEFFGGSYRFLQLTVRLDSGDTVEVTVPEDIELDQGEVLAGGMRVEVEETPSGEWVLARVIDG